jgi:hypothetical protein
MQKVFKFHPDLIRFKMDIFELKKIKIKYNCEDFELRNKNLLTLLGLLC